MVSLAGRAPKNTFRDLLQVSNSNSGMDGTLRNLEDGEGTIGPIQLSTSTLQIPSGKTLEVPGTFDFSGATMTGTLAVANGGTGSTTAAAARSALGVAIGTDVQAQDATLTSIAALGTAADKFAYTTGVDTWAEGDITAAGRAILDDADAAAQRATLGAVQDVFTTRGDIIVRGVSNEERLALGSNGQVLTSNGTDAVWGTIESSLPRGYIDGFTISNAADAAHDIQIAAGDCRSQANANNVSLASALTKQIDASWAEGNNAGGMFTGTVAADTTYHLCLISKNTDGTIDAGFDTSPSGANTPTGWTFERRIASVVTDASSNIIPFIQRGDEFYWDSPKNDYSAPASTTAVATAMTVPTGIEVFARVHARYNGTQNGSYFLRLFSGKPEIVDVTVDFDTASLYVLSDQSGLAAASAEFLILSNTSGEIRHRATFALSLSMSVVGWVDDRGKA